MWAAHSESLAHIADTQNSRPCKHRPWQCQTRDMLASRDAATEVGWRLKPAGSSGQPRVRHTERSSLLQKPAQMQLARSAHRVTVLRVEVPCQACGWSLQTVRNWKYLQCASAVLAVCNHLHRLAGRFMRMLQHTKHTRRRWMTKQEVWSLYHRPKNKKPSHDS